MTVNTSSFSASRSWTYAETTMAAVARERAMLEAEEQAVEERMLPRMKEGRLEAMTSRRHCA